MTSTRSVDEFSGEFPGAASTLLADLLMQPGLRLTEVARTGDLTQVVRATVETAVPA